MTKWGTVAGAPALLAAWLVTVLLVAPSTPAAFAAVLEPVVRATAGARAVHYVLHRLTREGEDFSYVDLGGPGMTLDIWVEAPQEQPGGARFRMEKPDRTLVFDGRQTMLYIPRANEAHRWEGPSPIAAEYWPANWIRELHGERAELFDDKNSDIVRLVYREKGVDTRPLPKAFVGDYDRETELSWARDTHALTALRTWIFVGKERRLYSELRSVEYLADVDPERFAIELPADVRFGGVDAGTPQQNALGPKEVARGIFEAAQRRDRAFLELYCPSPAVIDWAFAQPRFEILYIGEPFRNARYPGVYVPYKLRIGEETKEWNLALRNDNPQRRWVFDGGI